jgi:HD-like signal output (HDOD) protein
MSIGRLNGPALIASVDALFGSPKYKPPMLPAAALQVLDLSRQADVSFDRVIPVIEADPLFAASVLRLAQSPVYATATPVKSIQQALLRLGLQTLADMCMEASVNARVFRVPGFEGPMETIRRHSIATAHVARLVAQRARLSVESAFTIGLLHDVGFVAGLIALTTPTLWPQRPPLETAWPFLVETHGMLTERLITRWKLPADLVEAIASHHKPAAALDPARAALLVADRIVARLGLGLPRIDEEPPGSGRRALEGSYSDHDAAQLEPALAILRIQPEDDDALQSSAQKLVERLF